MPVRADLKHTISVLRRSWLVGLAAVCFLAAQLWMSWAVWQRAGNTPPEPDDSFSYITGIQLIADYGTLLPNLPGLPRDQMLDTGMAHVTYNLALGLAARATACSAECVYHASFFVGKAVLLVALMFLFSRTSLTAEEQAGALVVLGMYAGDPATHGLYWVVPSFWLLTAFIVMSGLFLSEWPRPAVGLAVGFVAGVLFSGIHPLSLWATLVLGLFAFLAALRSGWRAFIRKRWGLLGGFAGGVATMVTATLLLTSWLGVQRPAQSVSAQLAGLFTRSATPLAPAGTLWERVDAVLPSAWLIWTTYVRFLIAQPYLIVVAWVCVVLWRRRQSHLPLLWAAVVLGVLASALHPFGSRTVVFAWSLTYPLLAIGLLDVMARLRARYLRARRLLGVATILMTLAAGVATLVYSVPTVRAVARANDFTWDRSCATYLLGASNDRTIIEYSDKYALGAFLAHGLLERPRGSAVDYRAARVVGGAAEYFFVASPLAAVKREDVESALGRALTPVRECGFFTIFALR